jgi:Alginate export
MRIGFTHIRNAGKVLALSFCWILLIASFSGGEEPHKHPTPPIDDPFLLWRLDAVRKRTREIPQNIWERIRNAQQWTWKEYPDQVLIQEETVIKWPRYLSAALNTPEWLDLGFTNRVRREGFDYPFKADQKGSTWAWGQRTRFRATTKWKVFRAELELQGANSGQAADTDVLGSSTFNEANVQQLFISATLENFLETALRTDLHVGRINMDIGSRRLVARSHFPNTAQSFDGIHWRVADTNQWFFRAFFSEVVTTDDKTDRLAMFTNGGNYFWGLSYENSHFSWARTQFYYFGRDENEKDGGTQRKHSTLGIRVSQQPEIGAYDYEAESAWQFGTLDNMDHFAYLQHISLGYTFAFPWSPRVLAMYDYASGTKNPNGNTSHTFDSLFGARNFEYTSTSLFGPFFRSNISSPGIRLITHPLPTVDINVKYRAWYLAQSQDKWVNSGMQDPTGAAGNFLGQDLQVRLQWRPSPSLTIDAGYEHFFKGSYIKNQTDVPGNPPANDTNYFYVQTEVRF